MAVAFQGVVQSDERNQMALSYFNLTLHVTVDTKIGVSQQICQNSSNTLRAEKSEISI